MDWKRKSDKKLSISHRRRLIMMYQSDKNNVLCVISIYVNIIIVNINKPVMVFKSRHKIAMLFQLKKLIDFLIFSSERNLEIIVHVLNWNIISLRVYI